VKERKKEKGKREKEFLLFDFTFFLLPSFGRTGSKA
jgi:hypothetical protein